MLQSGTQCLPTDFCGRAGLSLIPFESVPRRSFLFQSRHQYQYCKNSTDIWFPKWFPVFLFLHIYTWRITSIMVRCMLCLRIYFFLGGVIKLVTPTFDDIFSGAPAQHIFFRSNIHWWTKKKKNFVLLHHCRVGSIYFDQLRTYTVNTPSTTDVDARSGPVRSYWKINTRTKLCSLISFVLFKHRFHLVVGCWHDTKWVKAKLRRTDNKVFAWNIFMAYLW